MDREFSPKHVRSHVATVDSDATKPPIATAPPTSYRGRNNLDLYNICDEHECHPSLVVADEEAGRVGTDRI